MFLVSIFLISGRPVGDFQGSTTLFLTLFSLIALALIGVGFLLFRKRKEWLSQSKMTYGEIVEISKRYARDDHSGRFPIYFPIVAYHVNGCEFRSEADKGLGQDCYIGQEIQVRYLAQNPMEVALSENNVPILNPTIFFILGILMMLSALALLFLK